MDGVAARNVAGWDWLFQGRKLDGGRAGVGMQLHVEFPHAGMKLWRTWGNRYLWLRLTGPGRVALQSCYERLEDPGTDFRESCAYSQHIW